MDLTIGYRDDVNVKLSSYGYITQDLVVGPMEIVSDSSTVRGRPGVFRGDLNYGPRKIVLKVLFIAKDQIDFALKRDGLFRLFSDITPYYIYEGRPKYNTETYDFEKPGESYGPNDQMPNNIEMLMGKRYYVIRTGASAPEQNGLIGKMEIEFETYRIPYGSSTATTMNPLIFSEGIWQTGQGLILENPGSLKYQFVNTTSFRIFNAGDVPVGMAIRDMYFNITFLGNSSNLEIRNFTNGSYLNYYDTTSTPNDRLLFSPPSNYVKNGANIFGRTNRGNFILNPGFNDIVINNAANFNITFDFRFYYK